jgi:hypothetical protein
MVTVAPRGRRPDESDLAVNSRARGVWDLLREVAFAERCVETASLLLTDTATRALRHKHAGLTSLAAPRPKTHGGCRR